MNKNSYCVIMAGGFGKRFWPVSTKTCPKQFCDILNVGKSFLRQTFERACQLFDVENILVVTNTIYDELTQQQLPELPRENILKEPFGKNTAPCIAYAAYRIARENEEASMVVVPSDHFISNDAVYADNIRKGIDFVERFGGLLTIGIKPTRPETGYGYIQMKQNNISEFISKVKTFTEKPNRELAQVFLDSGDFLWNAGIFIWKVKDIIEEFRVHLEDLYIIFEQEYKGAKYPDSVENITGAIRNCESLTSLTIGKGAKNFTLVGVNCPKLERVDVDAENPWISSEDGVVFNKDKSEILYYPASRPGEEYEVPNTVKRIMAENNSLQLKKVIFPTCLKELSSEWILGEGEIYFKGNLPQLGKKPESTASIYYLEGMAGWQAGQAPEGWGSGFQTVEPWSLPEDSAELYLGKREQSAEGKNMLNLVFGGMLESSVDQQTWSEVTSVRQR